LQLLDEDRVMTLNDNKRYLLLELPETSFPPVTEEICFRLCSQGLTPIITHPERNLIIHEMPQKLRHLLHLGCLAQLTAGSILGDFGRTVARFARQLVKQGYIQVLATDTHDTRRRPPALRAAVQEVARLQGKEKAWAMVTTIPEMILQGKPVYT
jgi:protein-tyrosine phosphatase